MKAWKKIIFVFVIILLTSCSQKEMPAGVVSTTPSFDFLQRLTLDELDHRLSKKEPLYVYFAWSRNSEECKKLQENYLEPNIEYYRWNGLITVVDLDEELPEALFDKSLRNRLEPYGIKFAPAMVFFYEGKVHSFIEWTPESNDLQTGIPATRMNDWMKKVNLIQ